MSGPITDLTGDVLASGPGSVAASVQYVGGSSAANVATAEVLANAATSSNTANAIVKRDSYGTFVSPSVFVNAAAYGAVASFDVADATANTTAIDAALTALSGAGGGTLVINKGVAWNRDPDTFPDEVNIWDYSGWDPTYTLKWTAQTRIYMRTADPGDKNANEFQLLSSWHPGLIIDNVSATNLNASIVFRQEGAFVWQITKCHNTGADEDFQINGRNATGDIRERLMILDETGLISLGANTSPTAQVDVSGGASIVISGTGSTTLGSATLTGTSTTFSTDFSVGDALFFNGHGYTVSAIASNTSLTLSSTAPASVSGKDIYKDPDNTFRVKNGSRSTSMVVTKAGNVGIGTETLDQRLTVDGGVTIVSTAYNNRGLVIGTTTSSQDWRIADSGAGTNALTFGSVSGGATTEKMRIDSSGNLLVGTTSADRKLTVNGGVAAVSTAFNNDGIVLGTSVGSNDWRIADSGSGGSSPVNYALTFGSVSSGTTTERMRISASGKVGIGQTNPGQKLDVNGSIVSSINTVTFGTTPTFDASLGNTQKITLTGNVTSSTLSNATAGQRITFMVFQDGTGSRAFVWPTNVKGATTIGSTANKCTCQTFMYDGTNAYAIAAGVTNM